MNDAILPAIQDVGVSEPEVPELARMHGPVIMGPKELRGLWPDTQTARGNGSSKAILYLLW